MPVVTATSKPPKPLMDREKHAVALDALAPRIASVRGGLVALQALLTHTPPTAPFRRAVERRWDALANEAHAVLRDAYGHMGLIATVDLPRAWSMFDAAVGDAAAWEAAGLRRLVGYWKNREGEAHWLTHEDDRALRLAGIPAAFDPDLLVMEHTDEPEREQPNLFHLAGIEASA